MKNRTKPVNLTNWWFGYERSRVDGCWNPVILNHDPTTEGDYGNGKRPERSQFYMRTLDSSHPLDSNLLQQWINEHPAPKEKVELP